MRIESESRFATVGFVLVAICLGVVQFSIFLAQTTFALAAILWLIVTIQERRRPDLPAFFLPLVVYAGLTLVSAAMSPNAQKSFIDSRQLLLWLMVPVVARFARGHRAEVVINVIIALGAAGAVVGIVQFAMFGFDDLGKRPPGTLSTYMTYSGVLMLVTGAAVSRLLFHRGEWIWPAIAVPALLVALAGDASPQRLGRRVRGGRLPPGAAELEADHHRAGDCGAALRPGARKHPAARVLDV